MKVYSIKEPVNNFYIYQISNLTDPELVLEHFEHALSIEDNDPLAKYLYDKWDDIEISPAENITARQYLDIVDKSGAGYDAVKSDTKCINVSDEYQKFIVEKKPRWRGKKAVAANGAEPEKAKPKPKAGKGKAKTQPVDINQNGGTVNYD